MNERDEIRALVNPHLKRILGCAELILPNEHFAKFRKLVLDEFGRNGLEAELEREFRKR